jgi:hypothetical protein
LIHERESLKVEKESFMHIKQDINNSRIEFENKIKIENDNLDKKKVETEQTLFRIKDEVEREIQKEKDLHRTNENRNQKVEFRGTFAVKSQQLSKKSSKSILELKKGDTAELSRDEIMVSNDHTKTNQKPIGLPKTPKNHPNELNDFKIDVDVDKESTPAEKHIKIKDQSPIENASPFEGISPMNIESPLEDISPIDKEDLSVSNKDVSKHDISYNAKEEKEVPLDFDNDKNSPKEDTIDYSDSKIEKIVTEETELYMPSYFICDEIYNFKKYMDRYKVYQIMPIEQNQYLTIGCELVLDDSSEFALKLF